MQFCYNSRTDIMAREIFIHGIYPRSEELVIATQGFDRGRVNSEQVNALRISDERELVNLQEAQNFSFFEDGKLSWQDIFRPFVATSEGFQQGVDIDGEITRWFDNNSFYRKPVIVGPLIPDFDKLDEFFPQYVGTSQWKATLPSPFAFAKLSEDRTTTEFDETLENTTQLIRTTIEHLETRGVSFIQLNEPYIPYHNSQISDIDSLIKSLKSIGARNRKAKLAVHSYFGNSAPLAKRLEDEGVVDAIGIDFLKTDVCDIPTPINHDLIAGVVDGRNSDIETSEALTKLLDQVQEHTRPRILYVTHNSDLESLPEPVARKKLMLIGSLK